jgi:MEMO1 family protein
VSLRPAAVAGSWYPGERAPLVAEVDRYLADVPADESAAPLVALIAPHAGLRYSGPVAAHAYRRLQGRGGLTAVLVGPSHRMAFDGMAVFASGRFETPLGPLSVDDDLAAALIAAHPSIRESERPHRDEHSLEMQLPFLRHVAPAARIVPVLMGSQSRSEVDALAAALARCLEERGDRACVLVASSDLSHYHPRAAARELDAAVVGEVERFDAEALMQRLERSHEHACGGGPMVAVMKAARALGARGARVLRYADSGDVPPHDTSRVVGYLAAVLEKDA